MHRVMCVRIYTSLALGNGFFHLWKNNFANNPIFQMSYT